MLNFSQEQEVVRFGAGNVITVLEESQGKKNHSSEGAAKPHQPAQECHCDACCSDAELGEKKENK